MTDLPLVRLIDDDADLLAAQTQSLKIAGFKTEAFSDPLQALEGLTPDYPGVVLSDVRMPGIDGIEVHRRLRALDPELPVILITGHGDVPMAVEAIRNGAWDFLTKPVGLDQLSAALRRASQARALVLENRELKAMRNAPMAKGQLLGASPAISHLREAVSRLAEAGVDVMITGPSGAGKEAVARAIHAEGPRKSKPFIHLACDTLDEARFDLDFFGAESGHPDAPRHVRLVGRIEKAHRGTLFLDRVDMLSPALQAKILHVIERREFWSAGAAAPRPLDIHVMASTSADLAALVAEGRFHADLFYRLSGVTLNVPPLSERRADIPVLFRTFLLAAAQRQGLPLPPITPLTQARLDSYDWPGNARELRQFAEAHVLGMPMLGEDGGAEASADLSTMMARYEANLLREALRATRGHVTKAMGQLGLARKTFYDKLARHGIQPETFRDRGEEG